MASTRKNKGRNPQTKSGNNPSNITPPDTNNTRGRSLVAPPEPSSDHHTSELRHPQESNFVPPSSGSSKIKHNSSGSIIRTRRQVQQQQKQQQRIEESFDPPSSSLPMQKEKQSRDLDRHENPLNSRQGRGPANPVSASSSSAPPPGSTQRSDPWIDSGYDGGRQGGQDQRYNHSGYPTSAHSEQQSSHSYSRYSNSLSMNASPTPLHYGYEPPRDMHPIGSLTEEMDLAAKEDETFNLDNTFPDTDSSSLNRSQQHSKGKNTQGNGGNKKQIQGTSEPDRNTKGNEGDPNDFRRRDSQDQMNRGPSPHGNRHQQGGPPPYQGYSSHGGSSQKYGYHQDMKGNPHGNYGGGPYNHNYPNPGSMSMQGGHGYYQPPNPYHGSAHGGYQQNPQSQPGGYAGYPGAGNQGYPPYSPHSTWSPERNRSSYSNKNAPNAPDKSRKSQHDNMNRQSSSGGSRQSGKKPESPPRNKRTMRERRAEGAWLERIDDPNNTTPEKLDDPKNDSNLLGIGASPFRSPLPPEKDSNDRSTPNKRYKRSPLASSDTPTGSSYYNLPLDTPGTPYESHLNFSPMGHFLDDPPSVTRPDHDPAMQPLPNVFGDIENTPSNSNSYSNHRERRPSSPLSYSRNHPPRSPFSNFIGNLSPLPKSAQGLQTSPLDKKPHAPDDRRPDMFPSKHPGEYEDRGNPIDMGYNMDRNTGGYKNSPPEMRSKSPSLYHSNSARERFRHNNAGPIRLQIGNVGLKQAEARKGLDGINQVVRGPSMNQRHPPPRSSPPPPFPFGGPESSGPPHRRQNMLSERPGHDVFATPLSNISNRQARATPMSSGSHYPDYYGGPGMIPNSAPRHYGMPLPGTTPIKSSTGKENENIKERRAPCNCKRSRCLKLYCECFAAERFCNGCNCQDCHNTPAFEAIRNEAIKATRAKNPNAFKPRFAPKFRAGVVASSPSTGHAMGCRCKKSACLKKYCECFEAGAVCGDKCKCIDCQNFIGSQALIDRRRKIKDHRGAEFAMRTADQAWKSRGSDKKIINDPSRNPRIPLHHSSGGRGSMGISPSPNYHPGMHTPGSVRSNNSFLPPHMMPRPGPGYAANPSSIPYGKSPMDRGPKERGLQYARSPIKSTPRTFASRVGFNPLSKKKNRKGDPPEPTLPVFGPVNPQQTKSTALGVFSYLSNDDLFNASLVSKLWSKISLDEELWKL